MLKLALAFVAMIATLGAAAAQDAGRVAIGTGDLFSNDSIVDGQDRWRTVSYQLSYVTAPDWGGHRPSSFGDILEYRLVAEILAPVNMLYPVTAPFDRRYAGALSFGMHTHWQDAGTEFSLGAAVTAAGPQTGLGDFHRAFHRVIGFAAVGELEDQIPNAFYPRVTFEAGRVAQLGPSRAVRPFLEVEAGPEIFARAGVDLFMGAPLLNELMLRDSSTGQLYQGTRKAETQGFSFVVGGDIAKVTHSEYLPEDDGYALTDLRSRVRAGIHYRGKSRTGFAGITYLGREFDEQPSGQFVGSVRFRINF